MEINQIQMPAKKKTSITDILEEGWELYFNNLKFFISYQFVWLIPMLLALAFIVWIPNKVAQRHDYLASKYNESVYPYIIIITFIALTYFLPALLRGVMMRYEGEEHKHRKAIKQSAKEYFRYFFVLLAYSSLLLLGYKLITNSSWLWGIIDHWVNVGINLMLLIPIFYFVIRYFLCLTAAIVSPYDRSAFKTSAYLMKNNYRSGILILLVISSIVYFLFSIGSILGMIFAIIVTIFFGSLFVISMNVVCYKKLEALKEIPADAPELRKAHPAAGLPLAIIISLIPLFILFPHIPQKIFYSSDFLVDAFSNKIIFDNGITIKRPIGWSVTKASQRDDNDKFADYYLDKPGNKIIHWMFVKLHPLKNSAFRKDKLNPEELHQLKNILKISKNDFDKCFYKITETIQEMNNQQEYPKGVFIYKDREARKEYTHEWTHTYFYRVIDNKYILIGHYAYLIYNSLNEEDNHPFTSPEALSALQKEREEADTYLKYRIIQK